MKQVNSGVFIAIIAVVVIVVGIIAYRSLFSNPDDTPIKGAQAEKKYDEERKSAVQKMNASRNVPFKGGQ